MLPHVSPDQGQGIGTRGACRGRPRQAADTGGPRWDQQLGGHRDARRSAPQPRCGPAHRPRRPLARCCPPPRRACCRTRHRSGPAPDTPGQQVCRRLLQIRRPHGRRRDGALGGATQHPAAGNGRLARVLPHRGVRTPLALRWPCTRPVVHRQRGPRRLVLGPPRLQGRTALPGEPGPPVRPRLTPGRRSSEGGLATQPRAPTGTGPVLDVVQPLQRRLTALGHNDPRPPRPAADDPREPLPGPRPHGSRPAAPPRIDARGGTPHRHPRQRPDPWGPGAGWQPQTTAPAPATDVDTRRGGGAHGIPVAAVRVPCLAAAAVAGVLATTDDAAPGNTHGHSPPQPQPTGGERGPDRPLQAARRGLTGGRRAASHDRQNRGDRPPARGEDGARAEDVDVRPHRCGNDRRQDREDAKELGRPCAPSDPVVVDA
jgi:hypothetical protein